VSVGERYLSAINFLLYMWFNSCCICVLETKNWCVSKFDKYRCIILPKRSK